MQSGESPSGCSSGGREPPNRNRDGGETRPGVRMSTGWVERIFGRGREGGGRGTEEPESWGRGRRRRSGWSGIGREREVGEEG
jgi:hypothetical protein